MKILLSIIGLIIAVLGALFALQGLGVVGGSSMSGSTMWAIIGIVVFVIGVGVIALGQRKRKTG